MTQGKFIVLYGINNIGKTTQAKKLKEHFEKEGTPAEYIKFPFYDLLPTGPMINEYLREGNPYQLTAREFQLLGVINKTQCQTFLQQKLISEMTIISEDYTGTSIAWGIGAGVDQKFLEYVHQHLITPDMAFLLDGNRFLNSVEQNHAHEKDEALINQVRNIHLDLAKQYLWHVIDANQPIEKVHEKIWQKVMALLR